MPAYNIAYNNAYNIPITTIVAGSGSGRGESAGVAGLFDMEYQALGGGRVLAERRYPWSPHPRLPSLFRCRSKAREVGTAAPTPRLEKKPQDRPFRAALSGRLSTNALRQPPIYRST